MGRVTVDERGRILVPKSEREALQIEPGDVLFCIREGQTLRLAKAINPWDALARDAISQSEAGETTELSEAFRRLAAEYPGETDLVD